MTTSPTSSAPADLDDQVVVMVSGRPVTRRELRVAFDRVADKANWKMPVDAVVDIASTDDRETIRLAVIFFTASVPTFTVDRKLAFPACRYRVRADGYYRAVGA